MNDVRLCTFCEIRNALLGSVVCQQCLDLTDHAEELHRNYVWCSEPGCTQIVQRPATRCDAHKIERTDRCLKCSIMLDNRTPGRPRQYCVTCQSARDVLRQKARKLLDVVACCDCHEWFETNSRERKCPECRKKSHTQTESVTA